MQYLTPAELETAYGNMQPGDKPIVYYAGSDKDLQFNRTARVWRGTDDAGNAITTYEITPLGETMRMAMWLHTNGGALLFAKRVSAMDAPYVGEMHIVKASQKTKHILDHLFDNDPIPLVKHRARKGAPL